MAVLALGSGSASAQPYILDGPEMMAEVLSGAIASSGANMIYRLGSNDSAEREIGGNPPGYFAEPLIQSGIAAMSRGFTSATVFAHPWPQTDKNVLALDAGIFAVANVNGRCQNITAPLADPTNPATAQVTTDMSIIFSGYPAGGPGAKSKAITTECASPQRLAAIARLASCQGVNRIDHIYRRDDTSGTQDTFREHLQFDRWCNGKSEGNSNAAGSNLKNADLDPIRRPCTTISGDTTKAPSRCTFYPLDYPAVGSTCKDGDVLAANDSHNTYGQAIPCTQGLLVALSENDPGAKDTTISIGQRIASDLNAYTMGVAGLAVVTQIPNQANAGANINTVTYEDANIRTGQYMLSRRLFLQRRPDAATSGWVTPARSAEETKLFNWATNRCDVRSLLENAGFVAPLANCADACTDPLNITCLAGEPGLDTPKQNIGAETTACDTAYPCVANGQIAASAGAICGGTGTNCPAIPAEAAGYACNLSAKCTTGGGCGLDASGVNNICK
jgi:hypothetical protein